MKILVIPPNFKSSEYLINIPPISLAKELIKTLKIEGVRIDPCVITLSTFLQLIEAQLISTLWI